jgi:hypothetical protein
MSKLVMALGGAIILAGLWMAVAPDQLFGVMEWESRRGQIVAASIRLVSGLILFLAASATRYPKGFRIIGGLIFVAGIAILLIPLEHWGALIRWALLGNDWLVRIGGGIGGPLIGALLIHAARPAPTDA